MISLPRMQPRVSTLSVMIGILALVIPLFNATGLLPDATMNQWGRYACFAIAAIGVDLIWGFTGILSLCQAFFFALGGYAIGMHMLLKTGSQGVYGSALPDFMVWNSVEKLPAFWVPFHSLSVTLILVVAVPAVVSLGFGFLVFRSRIKGVYFAVISQAFALAMYLVFNRNETMLGGTNGLTDFKTLAGLDLSTDTTKRILFTVSFGTLALIYFLAHRLTRTKFGRVLIAVRDREFRLRFVGYDVTSFKMAIFAISSVLAAIGGMLYVPQTGIITPSRMDVEASILMVIWVAVGGRGTLTGAIVGALMVNMLYSFLTGFAPQTWPFILGAMFVGVVLFFPRGIAGLAGQLSKGMKFASVSGNAVPKARKSQSD